MLGHSKALTLQEIRISFYKALRVFLKEIVNVDLLQIV